MRTRRVVVIGAGIGGLVAALRLACAGCAVTVLEAQATPGGKMRQVSVGASRVDAGPTVLTMRWVFDEIFEAAGTSLAAHVTLRRAQTLARHAWADGARLDLHADPAQNSEAIGEFAGACEAEGYEKFRRRAAEIFDTLRDLFICASRPNPVSLTWRVGLSRLPDLMRISPFATLWSELGGYFKDQRLRQLFGRYATYCGSSPFAAPATLMLVAHAEQEGVWLVDGGMHALAAALEKLLVSKGATMIYGQRASRIVVEGGRVTAVETQRGLVCPADAVVMNGDVAAIAAGLLGDTVQGSATAQTDTTRSLSALTFAVEAPTSGFPLVRHNVFFSDAYRAEFEDIFSHGRLPRAPTVYVCAQDRGGADDAAEAPERERLLCLVNAPANGGTGAYDATEIDRCEAVTFRFLQDCGLTVQRDAGASVRTTPEDFAALFPATQGALYGRASHGWLASFLRPGSRTRVPGLYLAGGSTHPGPGVPMAALSGRQAAASVMTDLASTVRSYPAAMRGGMSTR